MTELALPTEQEARALTDRIRVAVEGTWLLIQEAYTSRAWAALGYDTWDAYCTAEFGQTRLALPREERPEVVASLRDSGLSVRAIASATGINRETIRQEVAAGDKKLSPHEITGTDGKKYASTRPMSSAVRQVAALLLHRAGYDDEWITDRLNSAEMPRDISAITPEQLDVAASHLQAIGVTYYGVGEAVAKLRGELNASAAPDPDPEHEPDLLAGDDSVQPAAAPHTDSEPASAPTPGQVPKPKRRPLPEAFTDAGRDLGRAAERLVRLAEDDRFTKNRETTHHQVPDLLGALEHTARLVTAMRLHETEASEEARRWWATSLHKTSDALRDVANSLEKEI